MFSKILIANRGEVAVRIIRACKDMGISTVAVYSEADEESIHVALADEAICVGKASPKDSYLNMENIISAALVTGAQAIHPGYGFLAENAGFARLCKKFGLVFIGPDAKVIEKMGDKDAARKLMVQAGVPVVPGSDLIENLQQARQEARRIGFPLLIKASAGGGGKGIRLVKDESQLEHAFLMAAEEAKNAFGNGSVYMEKYLAPVKHIEIQLLSDEKGNTVCLGERECSIQRNNQKLLEEAPSSGLSAELRERMMEAAGRAAKAAGYTNAGTIEFLLEKTGRFYFMEMNTRIQVEHPVTEWVTGIDLIKEQIRIADGRELSYTQEDVKLTGHAIECRINAENPYKGFRPCPGKITDMYLPGGKGIRIDSAIYSGYEVPPYYDNMLAKLIVFAKNRNEAITKMRSALGEVIIEGIDTNVDYQYEILNDPDYQNGDFDIEFIADKEEQLLNHRYAAEA